jgi:hypothetical protein
MDWTEDNVSDLAMELGKTNKGTPPDGAKGYEPVSKKWSKRDQLENPDGCWLFIVSCLSRVLSDVLTG